MRDTTINCPFCVARGHGEDQSENLNIMPGGRVYHCFRCGARPRVTGTLPREILANVPGVEDTLAYFGEPGLRANINLGLEEDARGTITKPHAPTECEECRAYLTTRGYDLDRLSGHSWLRGGWFLGHRIFFQFKEGEWQGRAISPRNPVRYMTPPDLGHAMILPFPKIGMKKTPVIVEGPFDALRLWTVGIRAICLIGVSYGESKLKLVQTELWNDSRVILCLDKDGTDNETMKWAWSLSKFINVRQWNIRAHDPDTMGMVELKDLAKEVGG